MDKDTENQFRVRFQMLELAVEELRVEVAARFSGQRSGPSEPETDWEKHTKNLKEVLRDTQLFLRGTREVLGGTPVLDALMKRVDEALGSKAEPKFYANLDTADADLTHTLLSLVLADGQNLDFPTIVKWTQEQRRAADVWASQQQRLASGRLDESEEFLYPKPVHVRELEEKGLSNDDFFNRVVDPKDRPHPGIAWAIRMSTSPREWERLHRIEKAARHARAAFRSPDRDEAYCAMARTIDAIELERIKEWERRA